MLSAGGITGAEEQCLGAASREGSAADSHSLSGRCLTMQLCFQACPPSFPPASQERPLWLLIHIPFKSVTSGKPGALQAPPSLLRAVSCKGSCFPGDPECTEVCSHCTERWQHTWLSLVLHFSRGTRLINFNCVFVQRKKVFVVFFPPL